MCCYILYNRYFSIHGGLAIKKMCYNIFLPKFAFQTSLINFYLFFFKIVFTDVKCLQTFVQFGEQLYIRKPCEKCNRLMCARAVAFVGYYGFHFPVPGVLSRPGHYRDRGPRRVVDAVRRGKGTGVVPVNPDRNGIVRERINRFTVTPCVRSALCRRPRWSEGTARVHSGIADRYRQ